MMRSCLKSWIVFVLVVLVWSTMGSAQADKIGIVYQSRDRWGSDRTDLVFINEDGSGRKVLATGAGEFLGETDYRFIYSANNNIYSIKKNGGAQVGLATSSGNEFFVKIIGDRVIYSLNGNNNFYSVKVDGSGRRTLVTGVTFCGFVGDWMVYTRNLGGFNDELYSVKVHGTGTRRLTHNASQDKFLASSGNYVIFARYDGQPDKLYSVLANGSHPPQKLVSSSRPIHFAEATDDWVFYHVEYGQGDKVERDIWSVRPDGSNKTMITQQGANEEFLDVSGDRIVYCYNGSGGFNCRDIYSIKTNGSSRTKLTQGQAQVYWNYKEQDHGVKGGLLGDRLIYVDGTSFACQLHSVLISGGENIVLSDWISPRNRREYFRLDKTHNKVVLNTRSTGDFELQAVSPAGSRTILLGSDHKHDEGYLCSTANSYIFFRYYPALQGEPRQLKMYATRSDTGATMELDPNQEYYKWKAWPVSPGKHHQGFLLHHQSRNQPGIWYYSDAGTHTARLEGPVGTDFDLYLQKWNGGSWVDVARSTSGSSSESISYGGSAGYYWWRIYSYRGSGTYDLWLNRP
jgi:Tol biopolymer transport system component